MTFGWYDGRPCRSTCPTRRMFFRSLVWAAEASAVPLNASMAKIAANNAVRSTRSNAYGFQHGSLSSLYASTSVKQIAKSAGEKLLTDQGSSWQPPFFQFLDLLS